MGGNGNFRNFDEIYVLKQMETLKRMPFKARKSVFERLEQIVDIAALTKEEREKYDESIKVYRDHLATMEFAKQTGFDQGKEVGLAEGMAEGMMKGREEGIRDNQIRIARGMKADGMPIEMIAKYTGLSAEEVVDFIKLEDSSRRACVAIMQRPPRSLIFSLARGK